MFQVRLSAAWNFIFFPLILADVAVEEHVASYDEYYDEIERVENISKTDGISWSRLRPIMANKIISDLQNPLE